MNEFSKVKISKNDESDNTYTDEKVSVITKVISSYQQPSITS
jgi:hypothetical protein